VLPPAVDNSLDPSTVNCTAGVGNLWFHNKNITSCKTGIFFLNWIFWQFNFTCAWIVKFLRLKNPFVIGRRVKLSRKRIRLPVHLNNYVLLQAVELLNPVTNKNTLFFKLIISTIPNGTKTYMNLHKRKVAVRLQAQMLHHNTHCEVWVECYVLKFGEMWRAAGKRCQPLFCNTKGTNGRS
jgi:hypothetical protein